MATVNFGELLNLVGLSIGVVLYAMLLAMVVRTRRMPGVQGRFDPLLLLTAVLGLVWNLSALSLYELPRVGIDGPFPFLATLGYGALGFLPAVVVHSVLRGEQDEMRGAVRHTLAAVAYGVSAVAASLHFAAGVGGAPVPSALGMRLLTYAFVALVVPLFAATRGQPGSRRALWAAALAVFAVSALHLSQLHRGDASWPVELLGHHASLPLALAILYQDYPFALADLFLKRALSLLSIVTLAFIAIAALGAQSPAFAQFVERDPRQVGLLVTLWVGTALLYPALRRVTAWFVDSIILHRPNYRSLTASVGRTAQTHDDVGALLSEVCGLLGPSLSSQAVTWSEWRPTDDADVPGALVLSGREAAARLHAPRSVAAAVMVPTSEPPRYVITIAELTGGRRFLSDDAATLESIAVTVARRIDAIRISSERYQRAIREREIGKLATEAELRALRAQVNPHFLFNALTTIGHLIQTAPPRALQTLLRLTTLLRAVLRSEGDFTTLGRELDLIESYLDIERARFDERLQITIEVPGSLRDIQLPALILQPLVENAVKHGISQKELGGEVTILARVDRVNAAHRLTLVVYDSGAGSSPSQLTWGRNRGVGLRNIERRLDHHYGAAASLSIESTSGVGTRVEVRLPVVLPVSHEGETTQVAV